LASNTFNDLQQYASPKINDLQIFGEFSVLFVYFAIRCTLLLTILNIATKLRFTKLTMKKNPAKNSRSTTRELPEATIVKYLHQHPKFFTRHEELLPILDISNLNEASVSLAKRKVETLQKDNKQLQQKLEELIAIAQENEQLNQRIRRLIAALVEVDSLDEFFQTLYSTISSEFNTDEVVVRWFDASASFLERAEFVEYDAQVFTLFEEILNTNKPICGELTAQIEYLFPQDKKIVTAVLIPLGSLKQQGVLAMGSHDASRFVADMNTDFLKYLGELVSHLLQMWMRPSFVND